MPESEGEEHTRETAPIRIVILPSSWVVVGRMVRDARERVLIDSAVIRIWGTTRGIGQIATDGPTDATILDKCGTFRYQRGTEVGQIDCDFEKWNTRL